ncbi:glycosyltransferase [Desulfopila sp. IMCC35006]|uniref:glycosyltransferase n=1 Tax=Desulfopila sp. IMCC35006 TaxID=2569542 RepID=UPI0010AC9C79|nr:glycosyltransferase family 2 protein [Desulfopila sp. IMCC35006]TKB25756.1 glycosyltransferase [Desulfopila sp. IMCC35006]
MSIFLMISLVGCCAIIISSATFAVGMKKMRKLDDMPVGERVDCPLISIVVPACNEEKNIERSLLSLFAQEYQKVEIIVVNDRSTDRTSQVLDAVKKRFPGLIVHDVKKLPAGWMGKSHALSAGALLARGEYLLFTDADVVMEKTTVARSVAYMERNQLDHLTLIFKNMTHGWLLNSLILDSAIGLMVVFKPWLAKKKGTHWFVGIGAFNMIRRRVYSSIGGHEAIKMHPVDDMMLGRAVKDNGFAQDCLLAYDFVVVPWYDSVSEMIKGLEKNMFAVLHYRIALVPVALLAIIIPSIWPLWGVSFGSGYVRSICLATIAIRLATFYQGLVRQGLPGCYLPGCLLTPYISCYIIVKSALVTLINRGITWRGQHYALSELRKTTPFIF